MKEMIDYFLAMITPPLEGALVLVSKPSEIEYGRYLDSKGVYKPSVHGVILLSEPTSKEAELLYSILKPGAHIVLIPSEDSPIGHKGVIELEDIGCEVRDAIFVAEDVGSFYYTPKASRSEREAGLTPEKEGVMANKHPTVKPIKIMEWCARDLSPKSKVVDPFLGSGTTGIAMSRLGHDFVGIELQPEYAKISEGRIRHWMPIGTDIDSEAEVGGEKAKEGETVSIFDFSS
tara:strand:+ start:202 stop:897 length:696 start_codon:yes stop_codon:yes gene_type:complete